MWFLFIIGPLILLQLFFILLIPPLRRKLLSPQAEKPDSKPSGPAASN
jgi:hypothetical protein